MKRTPLKRVTPVVRATPIRKRGKGRFKHRRNPKYRDWIVTLPCIVEGRNPASPCYGPIDPDHVKTRAAAGDDVGNLVPLCRFHHNQRHCNGIRTFERAWGISLAGEARGLAERYPEEAA